MIGIDDEIGTDDEPAENEARKPLALNPLDRVRAMTVHERRKVAMMGEQANRIALERLYGKEMWALLLSNPKISTPEVARIARKPQLALPLIEKIIANQKWVRAPHIRRALLTNHKLTRAMITKILRATPKREVKLMPNQRGYPNLVRELARQMIK